MLKGLVGLSKLQPQYHANQQDLHLASALRARVYRRLKGIQNRDWQLKLKAALLPLVFFLVYALSLNSLSYFGFLSGYAFLGLLMVVIFLNLIHEVCHENLFENGSFNQVYMYLFDLIGA
ncbi:MAG: fatty acid desaturase, partial [Cyclobacteriaceae bacterium]|nr:fatty acid desaturase [Cyclobacteriaceae bacterium]